MGSTSREGRSRGWVSGTEMTWSTVLAMSPARAATVRPSTSAPRLFTSTTLLMVFSKSFS